MNPAAIRILHVSTQRFFRGGERQLLWLHEGLAAKGIASAVAAPASSGLAAKARDGVFRRPRAFCAGLPAAASLFSACRRFRPSILHCHDSGALTIASIVSVATGISCIMSRRAVYPVNPSWFNRWRYDRCRAVIAISEAVKAECLKVARPQDVWVVYDGVRWDTAMLSRDDARRRLGIAADAQVIGTVGYFTSEKNFPLLCALGRRLAVSFPRALIACVGEVPARWARHARGLSNLTMCGTADNAASLYNAFDLYVSASVREGLGSALLDAIVRDMPAAALDAGGTADLFPPSSGMPVPQGNDAAFFEAVEGALGDMAEARRKAEKLGAWARGRFDVETMVDATATIYESIAAERTTAADVGI